MADTVHVPCGSCFAVNRVAQPRLSDKPTCGRCKSPLFPPHPSALDDTSFSKYIEAAELPVVVDFWAGWCGPCRAMAPQFEAASHAAAGKAMFAKVDTEAARQVAARFDIRSIPTMVAFRGGREIARQSGALNQSQILRWLSSLPA